MTPKADAPRRTLFGIIHGLGSKYAPQHRHQNKDWAKALQARAEVVRTLDAARRSRGKGDRGCDAAEGATTQEIRDDDLSKRLIVPTNNSKTDPPAGGIPPDRHSTIASRSRSWAAPP